MATMEQAARYITREMLVNVRSGTAIRIRNYNNNFLGYFDALILWKSMVGNRRPWDHKVHIRTTYGEWANDSDTKTSFNYDIWSNIHYGYVGKGVNFSAWTLKSGAGYAQFVAGTSPPGYWSRRFSELGDADFLAAFDDPKDQAAIDLGINLWNRHSYSLTVQNVIDRVRARRNELQIAQIV